MAIQFTRPSPTHLRLEFLPSLEDGRETALRAREFLATFGLDEEELFACELALTEACNNAVHHVSSDARSVPIVVDVRCSLHEVDIQVTDHTPGFDLPVLIPTPEPDIVRGRGLYLIDSMMDDISYFKNPGANTLHMRKKRTSSS